MSLFLFVSSQKNRFAVICQHFSRRSFLSSMSTPEKKVLGLLYFFGLWRIFHLSRVVYCAFFHHKAVSVAGDGQTFSERLIHVHICGYCKKKDKNPRQGHWGKDSTSPVIQPFYFFTKNLVCLKGVDTFFSSALSYKVIVQIAMDLSE